MAEIERQVRRSRLREERAIDDRRLRSRRPFQLGADLSTPADRWRELSRDDLRRLSGGLRNRMPIDVQRHSRARVANSFGDVAHGNPAPSACVTCQ